MGQLGPFEPRPLVAVAVSGGADSLALALLVRDWTRSQGGDCLALVVNHGLRAESGDEARLTLERLAAISVPAECLRLTGLAKGPGLAERARAARHAALEACCAARGILHLAFGHHAADQAETVAMRLLAGSGAAGLAAMAGIVETAWLRRLRPLLLIPPGRLRATVQAAGCGWVTDPSNTDQTQQRARLRALLADPDGNGLTIAALVSAAQARGAARARQDHDDAAALARGAVLRPEGCAVLRAPVPATALATLIGMVSGAARPPSARRLAELAGAPRAGTVAGVRLLPAGRLGPGWLLVREAAAMQGPVAALPGQLWDGRFRVLAAADGQIGAWGEAAGDRHGPPHAVLRALPALRRGGHVVAAGQELLQGAAPLLRFSPRHPMSGAAFGALRAIS